MEKAVKFTIENASGQIIVRNDKGAEWKYDYKSIDTSVAVVAATIVTSMLNATLTDGIRYRLENNKTISYTLIQEI